LNFDVVECLAQVRKQDQDAARSLVDYLYPTVIKIVMTRLPRQASPEDVAQDVFLKMFKKIDQFRGEQPIEHWVSRITVNHCINLLRKQQTRPEWRMADLKEEHVKALEASAHSVEDSVHPAQLMGARELVENLLAILGPKDRLVIEMLEMEGCSIEEIRKATGWSSANVRVRAFRARHKLNLHFRKLRDSGHL